MSRAMMMNDETFYVKLTREISKEMPKRSDSLLECLLIERVNLMKDIGILRQRLSNIGKKK